MAEELKGLIEKIQEEGIKAAEEKAREIEESARDKAAGTIEKAKLKAEALIEEAKENVLRMEGSARADLKQAGRDLMISLKKEISAMLDKIIVSHVHRALTAEELAKIIVALVEGRVDKGAEGHIVISLKKEDLEHLERGFLSELKNEIKKGVTLKSSDEIDGGFLISYDSGKSYYDFTDKALARYISVSLRPKLAEILGEAGL